MDKKRQYKIDNRQVSTKWTKLDEAVKVCRARGITYAEYQKEEMIHKGLLRG